MVDILRKIIDRGRAMGIGHIDNVAFEGQVAEVEHVCHELGHAISLRLMTVGDGCLSYAGAAKLPDVIDKKLMTLDDPDENEALVLASELHVLPALGISATVGDFRVALDYQAIPFHVLEKRCGSAQSQRLGCAILRAIRTMIRTA